MLTPVAQHGQFGHFVPRMRCRRIGFVREYGTQAPFSPRFACRVSHAVHDLGHIGITNLVNSGCQGYTDGEYRFMGGGVPTSGTLLAIYTVEQAEERFGR